jgi:hypothetical protein
MAKKPSVTDDREEPELDVTIDQHSLDKEWLGQPALYHKYAHKLAVARIKEEEAKQRLDLVSAQVEMDIRSSPELYELAKQTEGEIKACVLRQPEYQKALQAHTQARFETGIHVAATTALDHRRKALENLVQLHGQDYFSAPRARGEDAQEAIKGINKTKARKSAKFNEEAWEDDSE